VLIDGSDGSDWNVSGDFGNIDELVIILLHELGHVYNDLPGSGGSKIIQSDGSSGAASDTNSLEVIKACLKWRFALACS